MIKTIWLFVNNIRAKIQVCFPNQLCLDRVMAHWFGRMALHCCRSSWALPLRTCFELLKSVTNNRAFVLFLLQISFNSSNHYTKAVKLVIFPVILTKCCEKFRSNFVQGLRPSHFWKPTTSRPYAGLLCSVRCCLLLVFSFKLQVKMLFLSPTCPPIFFF